MLIVFINFHSRPKKAAGSFLYILSIKMHQSEIAFLYFT